MKKPSALFLALLMLLSLAACGGEEKPDEASKPAVTEAPAEKETPKPEKQPEPDVPMTTLEQALFTATYPEADHWVYDPEDNLSGSDSYASFFCEILDENEYQTCRFYLNITQESAYHFRNSLVSDDISLEAAFLDQTVETREVGGYPFLVREEGNETCYYYRDGNSGMSIYITAADTEQAGRDKAMVEGLTFHLPDLGETDPPMPWDGQRFTTEAEHTVLVGTHTLKSQFIPFTEPNGTFETFDHMIELVGDKAYLASDYHLYEYAFDGTALTLNRELTEGEGYERIDAAQDGTLVLSRLNTPLLGLRDGIPVFSFEGVNTMALSPDGTWGVSYFLSGEDCQKVTLSGDTISLAPMPLTGISNLSFMEITPNYILTAGYGEDNSYCFFVLDHSGAPVMTLKANDETMGSFTYAAETPNGFLALDGNMRDIFLWTKDGSYIGSCDVKDIFGTSYPWLCDADLQPDGSLIVILTQERDDDSWEELLAYRLTGF